MRVLNRVRYGGLFFMVSNSCWSILDGLFANCSPHKRKAFTNFGWCVWARGVQCLVLGGRNHRDCTAVTLARIGVSFQKYYLIKFFSVFSGRWTGESLPYTYMVNGLVISSGFCDRCNVVCMCGRSGRRLDAHSHCLLLQATPLVEHKGRFGHVLGC